jgi:hypothetical protein
MHARRDGPWAGASRPCLWAGRRNAGRLGQARSYRGNGEGHHKDTLHTSPVSHQKASARPGRLSGPGPVCSSLPPQPLPLRITRRTSLVDGRPGGPWCFCPAPGTVIICIGRLHHDRSMLLPSFLACLPVCHPACVLPGRAFLGERWGCHPWDHPEATSHSICSSRSMGRHAAPTPSHQVGPVRATLSPAEKNRCNPIH